jgi:hypothetical protein
MEAGAGEILVSDSSIEEESLKEDNILEEKKEKKFSNSVYEENILLQYNKVQCLNVQELTFSPSPLIKTTSDSLVKIKREFVQEKEDRWEFSSKNKKN